MCFRRHSKINRTFFSRNRSLPPHITYCVADAWCVTHQPVQQQRTHRRKARRAHKTHFFFKPYTNLFIAVKPTINKKSRQSSFFSSRQSAWNHFASLLATRFLSVCLFVSGLTKIIIVARYSDKRILLSIDAGIRLLWFFTGCASVYLVILIIRN